MAWPNTPYVTFVANSTPTIGAAFLNAVQATVVGVINGTTSLKAVVIDGTGGLAVTGTAGTLAISGSASDTAAPSAIVVPWGTAYREALMFGGAAITGATGAPTAVYNVKATARVGAGHYTVTFHGAPLNWQRATGQVTGTFNAGARIPELNSLTLDGADLKATVFMYNGGVLTDSNFYLNVWGG